MLVQLMLVGLAAAVYQVSSGWAEARASLFGGGIAITNLLLLDWRARRANRAGALTASQSIRMLYLSALERFATVALLFALGMGPLDLEPAPLLIGFMTGLPALLLLTRPGRG